MNRLNYYLQNKIEEPRVLKQNYLDDLYDYYIYGSRMLSYNININKEDFQRIFCTIYDVIGLRIGKEDFEKLGFHYLQLIMADHVDGRNIDIKWFIDHVWYLCVGLSEENFSKKYKDCILLTQQVLMEQFKMEGGIKEKVSRKIYTRFMIK